MSAVEFLLVFALGLVSSIHCLQMCGPIVLAYSLPLAQTAGRGPLLTGHLQYNAGRVLTYTLLGAAAGAAGGAVGVVGRLAGVQNGARILSGLCMVLAGALIAGLAPRSGLVTIEGRGITSRLSRSFGRLLSRGKFALGLAFGFLPCGLVYAALLKSVETGTAAGGALTMLAFGMGTSGALVGIGVASSFAGPRLGVWGNRVAALGIALAGAYLVWRGVSPPAVHCHS